MSSKIVFLPSVLLFSLQTVINCGKTNMQESHVLNCIRIPVVQAYVNIFCKRLYNRIISLHHKSMTAREDMLL